jgi:hypothetical protein
MEHPGIGRVNRINNVPAAPGIRPFVNVQRLWMSGECRNQILIILVLLVFDADMVGRAAHPVGDRLVRIVRHLFAFGQVEMRAAVVVKVLADEVNVIEAIGQQPAGPVG